jgi:WD40 repeat protein
MVLKEHDGLIHGVAFSPHHGRLLLAAGTGMVSDTGDWTGEVKLWEIDWKTRTGNTKATLSGGFYINSVAFCPKGRFLAAGGSKVRGGDLNTHEGQVKLWDMRDGAVQAAIKGYRAGVLSMAFSPNGTILATGGGAPDRQGTFVGEVKLWDVEALREPSALKGGILDGGMIYSVAYAPDGTTLGVGGGWVSVNGAQMRGAVELWDLSSGKVRAQLRDELPPSDGPNQVSALAFSPDGKTLAAGLQGGSVKLYNTATLELRSTLKGHSEGGMITAVAFSPDGTLLASAARDQTIKVWDASRRERKATLQGGVFLSVAFSPDGQLLAAGSVDGTVTLWSVADLATEHSANENGLP